ncbi:MAG: hypothetical protein NC226_07310 [Bacteroides cellulosilyticus]|nr:hypothetical protein [Bacteroides cellulosilyticus]
MTKDAEQILEKMHRPLPSTYIEKLDAELQTLGWLARFPERTNDKHVNQQFLDKYDICPGIPRKDQCRQIEEAFRSLDTRLSNLTGRRPYADELFDSLRHKIVNVSKASFQGHRLLAADLADNLHGILRLLYTDMMALCWPMTKVATAIAGIGALLYIAYRIWQSLARAEPIDLFPLMRPFAIGICILFFPTLVLGSLNGILSPLVQATHSLMAGQTLDMNAWQQECARMERQNRERMPADSYYTKDEAMERELNELGLDDQT